jgi:hypothetical protein
MKNGMLVSTSVVALILAFPAAAQDAPPSATNAPQGAAVGTTTPDSDGLADIVVTAQRVTESSQRTPARDRRGKA